MTDTTLLLPSTGSNVDRDSKTSWINPTNIELDNTSYSQNTVDANTYSDWLVANDFGMTIPTGATIDGIEVEIKRKMSGGFGSVFIEDSSLRLYNGSLVGDDKSQSAINWSTSDEIITYGSPTDDWNASLTVNDLNSTTFAVYLSVLSDSFVGVDAFVNYIKVKVYYTSSSGGDEFVVVTQGHVIVSPQLPSYPAIETGLTIAGTGSNQSNSATSNPWTNPTAIETENGGATFEINVGNTDSDWLQMTNFGFNIPTDAEIRGMELVLSRNMTSTFVSGLDVDLYLWDGTNNVGRNMSNGDLYPVQNQTDKTYGDEFNEWGIELTPTLINDSDFGFRYSAKYGSASTGSGAGGIYYAKVNVYYVVAQTGDLIEVTTSVVQSTNFAVNINAIHNVPILKANVDTLTKLVTTNERQDIDVSQSHINIFQQDLAILEKSYINIDQLSVNITNLNTIVNSRDNVQLTDTFIDVNSLDHKTNESVILNPLSVNSTTLLPFIDINLKIDPISVGVDSTTFPIKINESFIIDPLSVTVTNNDLVVQEGSIIDIFLMNVNTITETSNIPETIPLLTGSITVTNNDVKLNETLHIDNVQVDTITNEVKLNMTVELPLDEINVNNFEVSINESVITDLLFVDVQNLEHNISGGDTVQVDTNDVIVTSDEIIINAVLNIGTDTLSVSALTNDPTLNQGEMIFTDTISIDVTMNDIALLVDDTINIELSNISVDFKDGIHINDYVHIDTAVVDSDTFEVFIKFDDNVQIDPMDVNVTLNNTNFLSKFSELVVSIYSEKFVEIENNVLQFTTILNDETIIKESEYSSKLDQMNNIITIPNI